jgi:hypothetical protein
MWQSCYYPADNVAMSRVPKDIHSLEKSVRYRVRQDFTDYYHNRFLQGEILTFVEYHFLPYHGGYTVVFQERNLYLQEQENANILDDLADYLHPVRN